MITPLTWKQNKGFTLLEMVVSIGIFTVLMITVTTIVLIVSSAQHKAGEIQAVQDNIRFITELLNKEIRTGTDFALTTFCAAAGNEIQFVSHNVFFTPNRTYFLQGDVLMRAKQLITSSAECASVKPLSGEEIKIDQLIFSLRGQVPWPSLDGQPMVTISMRITSRDPKFGSETLMNIQTTVTARLRDIGP